MDELQEFNNKIDVGLEKLFQNYKDNKITREEYYNSLQNNINNWRDNLNNIPISNPKEELCDCYIRNKINFLEERVGRNSEILNSESKNISQKAIEMEISLAKGMNTGGSDFTGIKNITTMDDNKVYEELDRNCEKLALKSSIKMDNIEHCKSEMNKNVVVMKIAQQISNFLG